MNVGQTFRIQKLDSKVITERTPERFTTEIGGVDTEIMVYPTRSRNAYIAHRPGGAFPRVFKATASEAVWALIGELESEARKAVAA